MGNAQLRDNTQDEQVFADELEAGSTLMHGQYTILSFLNAGGFGITYSARDSLDRRVVIKECFPGAFCRRSTALVTARSRAHQSELASIVRLFVQEARSLAKLDHPNIVGVHQVFEENNTAYMALDFVDGRDLLDMIEGGDKSLEPAEIEAILRKVLDAIRFVHDQGILHRDISPDNILLDKNKEPVLIDFGAAREQATKQSRVLSALRVVKDGYSPQEFYIAGSEQGPYSDLYALGASFYHLMTGELPPNSQARLAAVASGEADPYRPLVERLPTYRKTFLAALDQSLAILPKDRIASAAAWLDMIDGKSGNVATKPVTKLKTKAAPKAPEPKSRKGMMMTTVAVIAMIAAGVVATQTDLLNQTAAAPTTATVAPVAPEAPAVVEAVVADIPATEPAPEGQMQTVAATALEEVPEVDNGPVPSAPAVKTEVVPQIAVVEANALELPVISTAYDDAVRRAASLPSTAAVDTSVASAPALPALEDVVVAPSLPEITTTYDDALRRTATLDRHADAPVTMAEISTDYDDALRRFATLDRPATQPATLPQIDPAYDDALRRTATLDRAIVARDLMDGKKSQTVVAQAKPAPIETTDVAPEVLAANLPPAIELYKVPGMLSGWRTVLPFDGLFDAEGDQRIIGVNGIETRSRSAFDQALRATGGVPEGDAVTVTVMLDTGAAKADQQSWTLPVVHQTVLLNGLAFEATPERDGWVTRVTAVPDGLEVNMQVGDILLGHIATTKRLDTRTALPDVIADAAQGHTDMTFAVVRDGNTWAVALPFAGIGRN